LNLAGYAVLGGFYALGAGWAARGGSWRGGLRARRFRRLFPRLFAVLAAVAFFGALLNAPTNFDAYSYRLPRVLHWLAAQRWHWIHSADVRLNVVAPLFDWLSAPFLVFMRTERWIWLINMVSFLFLPGLIYSLFWRAGVPRRVAYYFMWILPAGYCYAMQAGSLANDAFAAVYSLAAIDFALRARAGGKWNDLAASCAAAALLGAAKQSNFPLLLPWLIATGGTWKILAHRPWASSALAILCVLGSIVPTSVYNYLHVGSWTGFLHGHDYTPDSPFWGVAGNAFWIPASNLLPPIFPWADGWNAMMRSFAATDLGAKFHSFEAFGYTYRAAAEQYSGLGFGVSWLFVISAAALLGRRNTPRKASLLNRLLWWTPWLGLLVFMAKVGINQNPRYLAILSAALSRALRQSPDDRAGARPLVAHTRGRDDRPVDRARRALTPTPCLARLLGREPF
jgi:hypothetical protein